MRYFIQFLLLLALINPIYAESIEANTFINAQQERRYRTLKNNPNAKKTKGKNHNK
jgi:hypothetical protein